VVADHDAAALRPVLDADRGPERLGELGLEARNVRILRLCGPFSGLRPAARGREPADRGFGLADAQALLRDAPRELEPVLARREPEQRAGVTHVEHALLDEV